MTTENVSTLSVNLEDRKELRKQVISIAWPAVTELVLASLFGAIDMIMVGSLGAAAIASIGLTNQPILLIMAVFQALNIGGTAIVSRSIGSKKTKDAQNATKQLIIITTVFSFLIVIPSLGYVKEIYMFMGAEEEVALIGLNYFRFALWGVIFQNLNLAIAAALRGTGDTKTPMKINVVSNIANVIMNYIFIFGRLGVQEMGVTGAGVATFASRAMAFVALMAFMFFSKSVIKLSLKHLFKLDFGLIKRVLRIGFPSALEQLVLRTGNLFFVKVVAGLGTIIYASHQISINILSFSFTAGMAFGMASSVLIGQSLGAGKNKLAEEYGKEVRFLGTIVSAAMGIVIFIFAEQIIGLYSDDPQIIKNASFILKMIAFIQPFQAAQLILAGSLRGAGDTKWPLYSTIAGIWGIRISFAFFFIKIMNLGLIGAWLAICIDQIIRYIILYLRFKTNRWQYAKV